VIHFDLAASWSSIEAFREIAKRPYPFILDAASDPERLGKHSLVGSDPFLVVHTRGDTTRLDYPRLGKSETTELHPFELLRELIERYRKEADADFPMPTGGAVGYLSYDLFPKVEQIVHTVENDLGMPEMFFAFYDCVTVFEHHEGTAKLVLAPPTEAVGEIPQDIIDFWQGPPVEQKINSEKAGNGKADSTPAPRFSKHGLKPCQSRESYLASVRRVLEHIAAGDVYQVNFSQRFETDFVGDPVEFYARLRQTSPAPFGACLFPDDFVVFSNSPERYLVIENGYIETRPIKGTRPRGRDEAEDRALARELAASEKDGAEHLMIVDLERNDLGRVCDYDTVHVPEFKIIESYANVHHMVSTVAGRVHPSRDLVDCITNSFPGGSITGAPKIRAIEIIDELELTARGVYCGSIGYIDFTGRVDLNIAIRTAVKHNGKLYFQVGGGIVADSDPEEEYQETITKAQSFVKALTGEGRVWEK
jgi:para-aminobenzoate synthetase component 1